MIEVQDGVRLNVQVVGDGAPVVLVPGFGLDHQVWDRQVRVLSREHRVVCVDQRGHGLSDKPLGGYDVDRLAADLSTVLEHLDLQEVTLVGWSFGGQVAFRSTVLSPKRVARLALVGSNAVRASRSEAFPFGPDPVRSEQALVAAEHTDRLSSRRETILAGFAAPPTADVLAWLLGISLQMPSWAAIACYQSMLRTDQVSDLSAVTQPVLQVVGAADPVHSASGAQWLSERLSSKLVVIPDCGHYPMLEAPDALDEALLTFARG